MPPALPITSLLLLSLLIFGCNSEEPNMADETSGTSGTSPAGAWLLDADDSDISCGTSFTGGGPTPVTSVSLAISDGTATLSVEPCFDAQEGAVTEGEAGFIANLQNESGETASLTCQGDGPDAYTCEHSWLEGEFRLERL